jgi:hypothetical protein
MRRFLMVAGAGFGWILLSGLTILHSSELRSSSPIQAPAIGPIGKATDRCHGTAIAFEDNPGMAAKKAKKEEKLVFVLHVSGNFEDPRFT